MHTEWDDAHTDHTTRTTLPSPPGLALSEDHWRQRLEQSPGGWLLAGNAMTAALTSGRSYHLMHTTVALDAIRTSGQIYASTGCLVAALYCVPLSPDPAGLRPHNLGSYLLETKKHTRTLVIQITPDAPAPAKGVDYLRLGRIHLRIYQQMRGYLTPAEDHRLRRSVEERVRAAAPAFDMLLANATGAHTDPAVFLDRLADTVPVFPYLGYLYFEVLSEYLMLHSASPETKAYAAVGELNNRLYKRLAFAAEPKMATLFDLGRFHPGHDRLLELVGQIEPALAEGVAEYTRQRLSHLFAVAAVGENAAQLTFSDVDFESLSAAAPSLLGQAVFRDMRLLPRYPQLYLAFEQAKALEAWSFWNTQGIPTPFNGFLPKGEIGINPAYPRADFTVWTAETCERGLLHPVEQLDVTFVPRLADLALTAMRRDPSGRAAGHQQPPLNTPPLDTAVLDRGEIPTRSAPLTGATS